jgi:hypothetical protein
LGEKSEREAPAERVRETERGATHDFATEEVAAAGWERE